MTANLHQPLVPSAENPRNVLYVGNDRALIEAALRPLGTGMSFHAETGVSPALMAAARHKADVVIVDLSTPDDARTMLIAALAAASHPPAVIVLARAEAVSQYLRYPMVKSVITVPLRPRQLRAAVTANREKPPEAEAPPPAETPATELKSPETAAKQAASPGWRQHFLSPGRFMTLVSNLYKHAAFVLLATLFAAFSFYAFLIGFFLLSSGWGAPVTLSKGHELVARAERDIGELKVNLNLANQRLSEAQLEAGRARRDHDDAALMVEYVKGTVDEEINSRLERLGTTGNAIRRVKKVMAAFDKQLKSGGMERALADLYNKRLISKKTYESGTVGLLEAAQRRAGLDTELEAAQNEKKALASTIGMLESLRVQLDQGHMTGVTATTADLILLAKQAVDARAGFDQAETQLQSAEHRQRLLADSTSLMAQRIAELESGPLGRAIASRIDVIFVPYGNERSFHAGAPLYTCALTVLWCHRAGTVGAAVPGESNAVHPFFGKPIRGFFVEARLDDPAAASQEIIHAGWPPLFF